MESSCTAVRRLIVASTSASSARRNRDAYPCAPTTSRLIAASFTEPPRTLPIVEGVDMFSDVTQTTPWWRTYSARSAKLIALPLVVGPHPARLHQRAHVPVQRELCVDLGLAQEREQPRLPVAERAGEPVVEERSPAFQCRKCLDEMANRIRTV